MTLDGIRFLLRGLSLGVALAAVSGPLTAKDVAGPAAPPADNSDCAVEESVIEARYKDVDFLAERHPAGLNGAEPVAAIAYYRQNVFPDGEHWLARTANRFNILTRESTLRAALPFEVGDRVTDEELEEAERILRRQQYLYDARVVVHGRCEGGITVAVIVRDVWTLTPSAGVARAGGDNRTDFGITESNLLGMGKEVSLGFSSDQDRSGVTVAYFDPNVLGSRWVTSIGVSDNDDGDVLVGRIERPFYALDATWAAGGRVFSATRQQPLEFLSEELYEIDADEEYGEIYFGRSQGRVGKWVDRFSLGFAVSDERYEFPVDYPGEQLVERRFAYPFLRWERIEDRFITGANLDRVDRTEDLNLGLRASARIGWSSEGFGGDDGDVLLYDAAASKRWYLTPAQLLGINATLRGRYAIDSNEGTEDLVARTSVDYLWNHRPGFSLYAGMRVVATRNLDPESQLTLGGDTDLRGYPSRYQPGDRSVLATLEERYYSDWFPFGLFRVGVAGFVDIGRAWFGDSPPAWVPAREGDHFDTLANVGIGLRLESIRTRRDRVFHIDLARPLIDGPGVDSYQLTFSAKRSL